MAAMLWHLNEGHFDPGVTSCVVSSPQRAARGAWYAWLYRNDRAWLAEFNGDRRRPTSATPQRVDWDARDVALASAVNREALRIAEISDRPRISLVQLCQAVPGLKKKLGQHDRVPLTAQALDTLSMRRPGRGKSSKLRTSSSATPGNNYLHPSTRNGSDGAVTCALRAAGSKQCV